MTPKQQELKNEIWRIWEIEIVAKECFQYSFYLHKPETKEEAEYLHNQRDFGFIRHILWRMTIIELSKLFSNSPKRDRFNVFHFISKLKKAGHFGDMGISEVKIAKWEADLKLNQKHIDNILTLRDKIYAHTDPKKEDYKAIDLSFQDVEILIKVVVDIIKEIYLVVFDAGTIMETPNFDRGNFKIIKVLAEERRKRMEELLGPRFKAK